MFAAKHEWSKAWLKVPRDNLLSHIHLRQPRIFQPSYELNNCPVSMNLLLGWEYARIWQKERNAFVQQLVEKTKPKFIKNNYEKWLEKRKKHKTRKMLKLTPEWSKSYPVRPRDHLKSHVLINEKNQFKSSLEDEKCPATITSLIQWEYARRWLEERDKFVKKRKTIPKRIKNDYESWLEKRKLRGIENKKVAVVSTETK